MSDTDQQEVALPDAPAIAGLRFRRFRDEGDFARMAAVINASKAVDGIERAVTGESLARFYAGQETWDKHEDILYAEIDGQLVGYGALFRDDTTDGERIFWHLGFLLPAWRRRGIGRAILRQNERRLRAIDAAQPTDRTRLFEVEAADGEVGKSALLRSEGYQPVRYSSRMLRSLADAPQPHPLPEGIRLRAIRPEHYEPLRVALNEAFADHWSDSQTTPEQFAAWTSDPDFDPSLWTVAWDGDAIAGTVLAYVPAAENAEYRRMRGWLFNVAVRRPWRGRGLARALMTHSLSTLRARGMTEAGLDVDTENLSGALRLYESLGFQPIRRTTVYRKPL